jgi:hypothetical protein
MTTTDSQNAERTKTLSLPSFEFPSRFSALLQHNLHQGLENPVRAIRQNCLKFYRLPARSAPSAWFSVP